MQLSDELLPHDANAELAVLSSILLFQNEAIEICVEAELRPEWFYVPKNQTVFQEFLDVHDSGGKIELISFSNRLKSKGLLEAIGGDSALIDINLFLDRLHNFAPSIADLRDRIELIRAAYVRRQIITGSAFDAHRALDPDPNADIDVLLDEIASRAMSLRSLHGVNGALPHIEDAAVAISQPIILPADVIEGVLHLGGKLVCGGGSKSFKTWLLIDLAVSVVSGTPWLNGYLTTKGRVLYMNLELPKAYCEKRIQTICDEHQIKLESGMLDVWNLRGYAMRWQELQRRIRTDVYALIIIDPIYKVLLGRVENQAETVASLMNELEVLAVRTRAAVAFGAHYSKGNQAMKEAIDRISGSGVFARDPDTILNFTKHEEEDCFTVELTLRNHPPQKSFVVHWEYPLFIPEGTLDPTKLKKVGRPPKYDPKDILELIDEPLLAGDIVELAKEIGFPERKTYEALHRLKQSGLVTQPHKRAKYERA
jgi:hypothetical protein